MPYRNDAFTEGQYYHVYNRGAGKGQIFFDVSSYQHLLLRMKKYATEYRVTVIAYCLMPNHYHLLLRQETDITIGKFMQVLFSGFVQSTNLQHQRTGTLFEGRFKHTCVDRWEYLVHLCRYIHRNPVSAKLVETPEEWAFSNYMEWIGARNGTLVDHSFVRDHFNTAQEYVEFVNDIEDEKRKFRQIEKYVFD